MSSKIEAVENAVKDDNPRGSNFRVVNPGRYFAGGEFFRVDFDEVDSESDTPKSVWAYLAFDNQIRLFPGEKSIVEFVCFHRRWDRPSALEQATSLLKLTGISSIVAIIITVTLCYLSYIHSADGGYEPPAVLSNALTVILGFYFGATANAATKTISPPAN